IAAGAAGFEGSATLVGDGGVAPASWARGRAAGSAAAAQATIKGRPQWLVLYRDCMGWPRCATERTEEWEERRSGAPVLTLAVAGAALIARAVVVAAVFLAAGPGPCVEIEIAAVSSGAAIRQGCSLEFLGTALLEVDDDLEVSLVPSCFGVCGGSGVGALGEDAGVLACAVADESPIALGTAELAHEASAVVVGGGEFLADADVTEAIGVGGFFEQTLQFGCGAGDIARTGAGAAAEDLKVE